MSVRLEGAVVGVAGFWAVAWPMQSFWQQSWPPVWLCHSFLLSLSSHLQQTHSHTRLLGYLSDALNPGGSGRNLFFAYDTDLTLNTQVGEKCETDGCLQVRQKGVRGIVGWSCLFCFCSTHHLSNFLHHTLSLCFAPPTMLHRRCQMCWRRLRSASR